MWMPTSDPVRLAYPTPSEVRLCRFTENHQLAAVKVIDLQVGQRMFTREIEVRAGSCLLPATRFSRSPRSSLPLHSHSPSVPPQWLFVLPCLTFSLL